MGYNGLYAKAFQYGMMFGKDVKPGDAVGVSVTNKDDVVLAVKKAYIDMSPRTLQNQGDGKGKSLDPEMKEALFSTLAEKIAQYMTDGVENFDDWHNKLCRLFIDEFSKILEHAEKNPQDATYGKAQKIVNMTFKYLYCFDDAAAYAQRFEPCHMAIDSYILDWLKEWFLDLYNEGKARAEQLTPTGKNQLPKWSHMAYKAEEGGVPQYIELQTAIRKKVKEMYDKPPIEAEFSIWYHQRKKAAEKKR